MWVEKTMAAWMSGQIGEEGNNAFGRGTLVLQPSRARFSRMRSSWA
ncbi:hypothetical protein Mhypo_03128 [Meiothermus hypogaeus]|uniref:Uncharacterized protein n=1 Tax=Meiothermus hypogaeus TaxID=884155 RepID=A0ABX9MI26_9DEIN|nr:hypothetical protein Mhypo_03128 [Meiothermus hypogaeus]